MILQDGMMGQMMEPAVMPEPVDLKKLPPKPWKLDGADGRPSRIIRSLYLDPAEEERINLSLARKYEQITNDIQSAETYLTDDAQMVVVAYGTAARIAKGAVNRAREKGIKAGLFRPISLWPFPTRLLRELNKRIKDFLVFEMSTGQMVEDVRLSLEGNGNIRFYGRAGGVVSTPIEIAEKIEELYQKD